jgi:low affinity Fe/Cu permease
LFPWRSSPKHNAWGAGLWPARAGYIRFMAELAPFDRFAEESSEFASHATFFIACFALVAVWLPSYFVFNSLNTWQLVINTATTIVTFLLVALLQNSQRRFEQAVQRKLDAIADGLADLMTVAARGDDAVRGDIGDLRRAVGIENTSAAAG